MKPRYLTSLFLAALACQSARGAGSTFIWSNAAGGSWGTVGASGNWSSSTPTFATDDVLDFSTLNITAAATTTLDGARTAGVLKFGDATTASHDWTVSTGSAGPLTLSVGSGTPTIEVVNRTATISAVLAGTQGFQKTGAGSLVLTGSNTFSGGITIAAGTLQAGSANALGSASSNGISFTGGTLQHSLANNTDYSSRFSTAAGQLYKVDTNSRYVTWATGLSSSGGTLTKSGSGEVVLTGASSYGGMTTVSANGGAVVLGNLAAITGGSLASATGTNYTVNSGGALAFRVGGAGEFVPADVTTLLTNLSTGGTTALKAGSYFGFDTTNASGGTFTYPTVIGDGAVAVGVGKYGTNTLALSAVNTYTGGTLATNGTVNVTNNQSAATGGWSVSSPINNPIVNFQSGSTIVIASGKTVVLSGANSSGGSMTLNVAGTVTNNGTLSDSRLGVLNLNSGANWTQNGTMAVATSSATFGSAAMTVNTGAIFTYAGSAQISLSPSTSGSGSSSLTIAGGTFVTGQKFANTVGSSTGGANLILSSGGTLKLSADIATLATTTGSTFNFRLGTGGGIIDTDGHSTTITQGIANVSGQTGSLTKQGAGTLTLSGANIYTGATSVNAGTLSVSAADQFSDSAALTLTTGATLDLNHTGTDTVGNFRIDGVTQATGIWGRTGSIAALGATHESALITGDGLIDNTNNSAEYYWDGTGTAWSSTGAWSYAAANPASNPAFVPDATSIAFFGGDGLVDDQSVQLGGDRGLSALTFTSPVAFNFTGGGSNSTLTVGASGITVNSGSFGATFGSVTAGQQVNLALGAAQTWTNSATSGPVTLTNGLSLGANTLTTAGAGSFTVNGAITGTGGLRKMGSGFLDLYGTDTFTGDKTIDRGSVVVAGNQNAATGSWILRGYGDSGSTYNTVATTVTFDTSSAVTVASGKTIQLGNNSANGGFQAQTLNANGTVTGSGSLFLGRVGILNVGGTWTQSGSATVAAQGGGIATMTVTAGGSFTYTSGTQFVLTNSSGPGTLALNGGTFTTGVKLHNTNTGAGGTNPATVVLSNGGIFKLSAAIADLFTTAGGAQSFQVGSGGGIVDTNGSSTTLNVPISGSGGLTKSGAGTLTTTGANSYTGDTTVNGGTLSLAGANLANASAVTIASGAVLNLNFAGTDSVASLTINGSSLPVGVYSSSTHPAYITGSGTLTVTGSGFNSWALGLGLSGNANADFDKDGMSDAAEYVLGTDPKVSNASGIQTQKSGSNLIITFNRADSSETADISLYVEAGGTLQAWPQVFQVKDSTANSTSGVVITENGASADTVVVTIPTSGAPSLFARLKVLVSGS